MSYIRGNCFIGVELKLLSGNYNDLNLNRKSSLNGVLEEHFVKMNIDLLYALYFYAVVNSFTLFFIPIYIQNCSSAINGIFYFCADF